MHIVGFDLSLANTGWATCNAVGSWRNSPGSYSTTEKTATLLPLIVQKVCSKSFGADLVVLEAPALNQNSGRAHSRAGLWWLCYLALTQHGLTVAEVPPTTLKKWATGRGNASKADVMTAIIRMFPQRDLANEDESDALCLWAMGAQAIGYTETGLVAWRQAQLNKIRWR